MQDKKEEFTYIQICSYIVIFKTVNNTLRQKNNTFLTNKNELML